ncbi:hypothetical protein HK405_003616, partial [Cladochytrium tenue]
MPEPSLAASASARLAMEGPRPAPPTSSLIPPSPRGVPPMLSERYQRRRAASRHQHHQQQSPTGDQGRAEPRLKLPPLTTAATAAARAARGHSRQPHRGSGAAEGVTGGAGLLDAGTASGGEW